MKYILSLSCFFISFLAMSADGKVDSLINLLDKEQDPYERLKLQLNLGEACQNSAPNQSKFYYAEAYDSATSINDSLAICKALYGLGIHYDLQSDYDNSTSYFKEALAVAEAKDYSEMHSNILNSLGVVSLRRGSYEQALMHYLEALKLVEQEGDTTRMVKFMCNAGHVFYYQNQYDKALEYYENALSLAEGTKDPDLIAECLQHSALIKQLNGEYTSAIADYRRVIRNYKSRGSDQNQMSLANVYQNLGVLNKMREEYATAVNYYDSSLVIYKQIGNLEGQAQSFVNLGELYIAQKKYEKAESVLINAFELSKEINSLEGKKYSSASLAEVYESKGDYASALAYQKDYTAYSDSLLTQQSSGRIAELEAKYNSAKKEQEIEMLKARESLLDSELAREKAENQRVIFAGIMIALILALGAIVYFSWQRSIRFKKERERQRDFSNKMIQWQESERKRIAGDLHDGVGQSLVLLKNNVLQLKQKGLNGSTDLKMNEIVGNITNTIEEVRGLSYALRPYQIDFIGLKRSLEEMASEATRSSGIDFRTYIDELEGELSSEEEVNLFRIIQECLNNAVKHSAAGKGVIHVAKGDSSLNVRIIDDGVGFDAAAVFHSVEGFGLKGVKERCKLLGGKLRVESALGEGTRLMFSMPLKGKIPKYDQENSSSG
jgi:signal transduction histidine kinase